MSNLKETKRRILSVKNTQKITKAMQLVSASKFAKAVQSKDRARVYHEYLSGMLADGLVDVDDQVWHKYRVSGSEEFARADAGATVGAHLLVVIAADRGLCGALNAQVLKKAQSVLEELRVARNRSSGAFDGDPTGQSALGPSRLCEVLLWGKKSWPLAERWEASLEGDELADDGLVASEVTILKKELQIAPSDAYGYCMKAAEEFIQGFVSGRWSSVSVVHSSFESVLVQNSIHESFLPVTLEKLRSAAHGSSSSDPDSKISDSSEGKSEVISTPKILWEPQTGEMVPKLIKQNLVTSLYRMVLESQACEQAARMTAMDNATQNAGEVIKFLTLKYNRVRQAAITTELVEITSGAEALNG